MMSAALMERSFSTLAKEVKPAQEVMSEGIDRGTQTTESMSEVNKKPTVRNAATMTETLSELAEQACKFDIDEQPKFNVFIHNCILNSVQNHGSEGEKKQKIKWLLFDCDNTLVLSETLAFMASFNLVNEVLQYKGIDHHYLRDELLIHFLGLSFNGICRKMAKQFNFEWTAEDESHFEQREEDEVIKLFRTDLKPMPGIIQVFVRIVREMRYNIAIVSSSSYPRINAALEKTNLHIFFLDKYIFSAKSCLKSRACKPDPAIYLHALEELGVNPQDCVCIEDSRTGVMAAVRAGIPCIGFLGSYNSRALQDQLWIDFHKDGCAAIMWEWSQFFDILNALEDL